jgi:hypothetical protein
MLEMRRAHAGGTEDPHEVRGRMSTLASRFPGALRELDDLEIDEIDSRIAALDAVLEGTCEVELWMEAVALFHTFARGALCAKRWLRGRKGVDLETRAAFAAAAPTLLFPEESRAWTANLERIASPPRGRVTDAVVSRVATELGATEREVRRLVFGPPKRERRPFRP